MDDQNVHHFWGLSPPIDLLQAVADLVDICTVGNNKVTAIHQSSEPVCILQACGYDCRHLFTTLCRAMRHQTYLGRPVHIYVYEEDAHSLARHMLLFSVVLDDSLPVRERMEFFLELFGNALVRDKTAEYLDGQARFLSGLLDSLTSQSQPSQTFLHLFDASILKYQDKDILTEAFQSYRQKVAFDMVHAWDARCRKFYGDRYDHRKNLIDWDYHMRLLSLGTPGQDPALGSIIHFHHFRFWRQHGIAYELRDSSYTQPNRTMVTTAVGRTKEFKDRNGKDVGRSVAARGFWGDILDSPYHCFGVACEEPSFFKPVNQQFSRTAVDVAHFNVTALLEELRTGEQYRAPDESNPPRAKVARGPTSPEDLVAGEMPSERVDPCQQQEASAQQASRQAASADGEASESEASEESSSTKVSAVVAAVADAAAAALATTTQPSTEEGGDDGSSKGASEESAANMAEEAAALREREAELNAAAWQRLDRFKLVLLAGDLTKQLTGRSKYGGMFDAIFVGNRHVHLLGKGHKLYEAAKPGALLVAESARNVLQLRQEQVDQFEVKVAELAKESGWDMVTKRPSALSEGHLAFQKKLAE